MWSVCSSPFLPLEASHTWGEGVLLLFVCFLVTQILAKRPYILDIWFFEHGLSGQYHLEYVNFEGKQTLVPCWCNYGKQNGSSSKNWK